VLIVFFSLLNQNTAVNGGAIFNQGADMTVFSLREMSGNRASMNGGAVWSSRFCSIENGMMDKNIAEQGRGGAVYHQSSFDSDLILQIIETGFRSNVAQQSGGAIYKAQGASVEVRDLSMINNTATAGGSIWSDSSLEMTRVELVSNNAGRSGGAVHIEGLSSTIMNCSFNLNRAQIGGGAIYENVSQSFVLNNCSFTSNEASSGGHGLWSVGSSPSFVLSQVEMTNNGNSRLSGGAIELERKASGMMIFPLFGLSLSNNFPFDIHHNQESSIQISEGSSVDRLMISAGVVFTSIPLSLRSLTASTTSNTASLSFNSSGSPVNPSTLTITSDFIWNALSIVGFDSLVFDSLSNVILEGVGVKGVDDVDEIVNRGNIAIRNGSSCLQLSSGSLSSHALRNEQGGRIDFREGGCNSLESVNNDWRLENQGKR